MNTRYLDRYYPPETKLASMYPSGADPQLGFLCSVPGAIERNVASRVATTLDPNGDMQLIVFDQSGLNLIRELGYPVPQSDRILSFQDPISDNLMGPGRNKAVIRNLVQLAISDGSLVMSEPFRSNALKDKYNPDGLKCLDLGNKGKLGDVFEENEYSERLREYMNGRELMKEINFPDLPFVVKLDRSSSMDGVQVCKTETDIAMAKTRFGDLNFPMFIEAYQYGEEIGVQFGKKPNGEVEVIGMNRPLFGPDGYSGNIIRLGEEVPDYAERMIMGSVSRAVSGWFGVGSVDLKGGKVLEINARPTAATTALIYVNNGWVPTGTESVITLNAQCLGDKETILRGFQAVAQFGSEEQRLALFALNEFENGFNVNAAVLAGQSVAEVQRELQEKIGLKSAALEFITGNSFTT